MNPVCMSAEINHAYHFDGFKNIICYTVTVTLTDKEVFDFEIYEGNRLPEIEELIGKTEKQIREMH